MHQDSVFSWQFAICSSAGVKAQHVLPSVPSWLTERCEAFKKKQNCQLPTANCKLVKQTMRSIL